METSATIPWLPRVRGLAGQSHEITRELGRVWSSIPSPHHPSPKPPIRRRPTAAAVGEFDPLIPVCTPTTTPEGQKNIHCVASSS
jgi:hypothetical protein